MPYKKLILLAPCHGLEDFPLYHTGDDAASLLACWTAMWHPLLLQEATHLPHVERCDYPPEDMRDALLLLPRPCETEMDVDLPAKATQQGATLLRGLIRREDILAQALQGCHEAAAAIDAELVQDFLAFGFAFLQVELLTQQMRYASCIDQTRIARTMKEAAAAALAGDTGLCREKLTSCHDALADERSHYYPVDVYLLDLTLLAPVASTLGDAFERQLQWGCPQNFLASGECIDLLARTRPEVLVEFKAALQENRIGLAGGEWSELPLPLMSLESGTRQLRAGREAYRRHLGLAPTTYGRRLSGIYPSLLYGLRSAGFTSALHIKFDEGHYPESGQCKTKWQADERTALEAYTRAPLDAASHDTFLRLPSQLSEAMDTDHVAARMFLHWPGQETPWYDDLRRCHRYGSVLGRFVTLADFFSESADAGTRETFVADDYRYPFLRQAVAKKQAHPLTRWTAYWERSVRALSAQGLGLLSGLLRGEPLPELLDEAQWVDAIEADSSEHERLDAWQRAWLPAWDPVLGRRGAGAQTVINPLSFPRRIFVETSTGAAVSGESVYAAERTARGTCQVLVDVPAMGFASFHGEGSPPRLKGPELAEGNTLQNEFLVATIDPETGALRSLKDYRSRTTRMSQKLGLRIAMPKTGQPWVDRQAPVAYSVMAADAVEITANGKVRAEITSRGRLLAPSGDCVGAFLQRYQTTRGSRILTIEVELDTDPDLLLDDPWESYYACRWAFGDESAVLRAGTRMQAHDVSKRRFEAPLFVDVDCGHHRTTVLTGGLPYHRRIGQAQLDTLLCVAGETSHSFRLGIGVDLVSPVRGALELLAGDAATVLQGASQAGSGWLLHADAKNVVISSAQCVDAQQIFLRIVETEGRAAAVRITCCKPIREAHRSNLDHEPGEPLEVRDGVLHWKVKPHQVAEVLLQL